jgi:drug/metabolite transporter (DMT)-like permease
MPAPNARRAALCTCLALLAFAANSLLCRAALGPRLIDAASFTSVRLVSGAIALVLLAYASGTRPAGGSWAAAAALFAYAIGFSFAYLRIPAGVGALILFGCVQATMFVGALARGDRLRAAQWTGLALALAGLAWLTLPGAQAPDALGAALMALAGLAWGAYSLYGRGNANPLGEHGAQLRAHAPLRAGGERAELRQLARDDARARARGHVRAR